MRRNRILAEETREVSLFNYLQAKPKWTAWAYRMVNLKHARELVREGKAEPVLRQVEGLVRCVGYRATQPERESRPSPCTLTLGTMEQVADAVRSDDRSERRAGVVKFHVWGVVPETFRDAAGNFVPGGVYKSPTIRPRVSEAEQKQAMALLRIPVELKQPAAPVISMPIAIAPVDAKPLMQQKPLAQRTASEALLAAAPRLGLKLQRPARVQVA